MGELLNTFNNARMSSRDTIDTTVNEQQSSAAKAFQADSLTRRATGYHPQRSPMYIKTEKGGKTLRCQFDPKEFDERYSVDYAIVPVTGNSINPITYKTSNPRVWSMKLFFNDLLSNPASAVAGAQRAEDAIALLQEFLLPSSVALATQGLSPKVGSDRPPTLLVFLLNKAFRCQMTGLSIKRMKIHPISRATLRAEADVEFTEFYESFSAG